MNHRLLRLRALATGRHFSRHRAQLVLALVGVVIGVAAVVAVDLARGSVRASFEASLTAVAGSATHRIEGGSEGVPATVYDKLRRTLGWLPMAPSVEAQVVGPDGRPWTLLGIDPLREVDLARPGGAWQEIDGFPAARWFAGESLVLLPEGLQAPGTGFSFEVQGHRIDAEVAGRYPVDGAPTRVVIADLSAATRWLERGDWLDAIAIVVSDDELARVQTVLSAELSAELVISPVERGSLGLSRAFELNLTALSLLTAMVGVFIVYNTFNFLVMQRRRIYALEHALGASPRARVRTVLAEAAVLGLAGTVVGILAGIVLGRGAFALVQQTVTNLYFDAGGAELRLAPLVLVKALAVGLGGCLLAGWAAGRTVVGSRRDVRPLAVSAGLVLLAGLVTLLLPGPLLAGLAGVFGVALGYALLGGPVLALAAGPLARQAPLRSAPLLGLSARRVPRSLDRTVPAVAALTLAVATVGGVGLMIDSFRASVAAWLDQSLSADYYLAADQGTLTSEQVRTFGELDSVIALARFHTGPARLDGAPVELSAQELGDAGRRSYRFLAADERVWEAFAGSPVILVTENLARLRGVDLGDELSLASAGATLAVRVGGIIRDYRTGPGRVLISWPIYAAHFGGAPAPTSIGLYLRPGAGGDEVEAAAGTLLAANPAYRFAATGTIRQRTLEIFDQTFQLTRVMQWIAAVVALVGLTGSLMALQLERHEEFRLLTALGLRPAEQRRLVRIEAFLIGGVVAVFALPLGGILAWALTRVINPRAFGWRLDLVPAAGPLLSALAVALLGAWFAGLVAGRRDRVTVQP